MENGSLTVGLTVSVLGLELGSWAVFHGCFLPSVGFDQLGGHSGDGLCYHPEEPDRTLLYEQTRATAPRRSPAPPSGVNIF